MLQLDQFHQLEMNCLGCLGYHDDNGHTLWKDSEKTNKITESDLGQENSCSN